EGPSATSREDEPAFRDGVESVRHSRTAKPFPWGTLLLVFGLSGREAAAGSIISDRVIPPSSATAGLELAPPPPYGSWNIVSSGTATLEALTQVILRPRLTLESLGYPSVF